MANFAKITPINMGEKRNKFLADGVALADELFTAVATNGATSATLGAYFEMTERDDKYLIIAYNADATTAYDLTIKAGNDKIFGSGNDLTVEIAAGDVQFIKIDSGRFKNASDNATLKNLANLAGATDTLKDCVVLVGEDADIKVAVVKLPA